MNTHEAASGQTENVTSVHVRKLFNGDDLVALKENGHIDTAPAIWDVGMPVVGDRPVIDDTLVRSGRAHKERVFLKIDHTNPSQLNITIGVHHKSKFDTGVLEIMPPFMTGVEDDSVFSERMQHRSYSSIELSVGVDGSVAMTGVDSEGVSDEILHGNGPWDQDYERAVNFCERMIHVPLIENRFRPPLNGIELVDAA